MSPYRSNRAQHIAISIALLTLVGYLDLTLIQIFPRSFSRIIFYISIIAWTANTIGGKYAYGYAIIAASIRVYTPEYYAQPDTVSSWKEPETIWLFLNLLATFTLITYVISRKNHVVDELERTSLTDHLTKLANQRGYKQRIDVAVAHTRRWREQLSIAYIDVDNFKKVNDTHGHHVGDELLVCIANTIQGQLRGDDLAARLGGDEFAIVFVHSDTSTRLIERIKRELDTHCCKYKVSFSIGVVHYDGSFPATSDDITHYADELMYRVKKSSKDAILSGFYKNKE